MTGRRSRRVAAPDGFGGLGLDEARLALALLAAGATAVSLGAVGAVHRRNFYPAATALRTRLARRDCGAELMRWRQGWVLLGYAGTLEALFAAATARVANECIRSGAEDWSDRQAGAVLDRAGRAA